MLDRSSLLALAAAGATLSFLLTSGVAAQAPGSPPTAGPQQGFPSFFDQRRLPNAGPNQADEVAKRLKAEEARRKAAEVEAARARRLAALAEAERIKEEQRRRAAEAEASRKAAETRRIALEDALRRQAAEAAARQKADQARRAAALAAALAQARREAAEKAAEEARLAAQAEAKRQADAARRAAAEKRRLEQQRAIAAEAEPRISAEAAKALAAKAAASRRTAEIKLISSRAARAETRRLANEARKRANKRKAAATAAATPSAAVRPDNPALSRYQVGLDEEFDAMEAGLDEEFDPAATAEAGAPGSGSPAIKRATVGAALTSSTVVAPDISAPPLPSATNAKDCLLVGEQVEQGVLRLRLRTSANTKGAVTASINDIVYLANTAPGGEVELSAPLLGAANVAHWTFPGNEGCSTQLRPADPSPLLQVALLWQGKAVLNLHVLEPGAWKGGLYGHIWRKRPNADLEAGAGRLSLFAGGGAATNMQVYAVDPRSIGKRRLLNVMIDFASRGNPPRPPFCSGVAGAGGLPLKYQVHILRPAGPRGQVRGEVRNFEFAPAPCGRLIPARQRYEKLSLRP